MTFPDPVRSDSSDLGQALVVRPGDQLIVRVSQTTTPEQALRVKSDLAGRFPHVEVTVLGCEQLAVYRPALCGARGLAIAAEGAPVQVPRCGKPLGHVEAGDRWHTPDVDDWGPDMRWSAAAGVLRTPAGLTPEQAATIRRVFEAQYPPRPDDLPPDQT